MFFNEEDVAVLADNDTRVVGNDIPLDAAGDSPAAGNANCNEEVGGAVGMSADETTQPTEDIKAGTTDLKTESDDVVDLDFDDALQANGNSDQIKDTMQLDIKPKGLSEDGVVDGNTQSEISNSSQTTMEDSYANEDVDLDFDVLDDNNTSDGTNYLDPDNAGDSGEVVDLDFSDSLQSNGNSDQIEDTVHEDNIVCEEVSPITFSENQVRVFQRKSGNLIMESDLEAVMQFYQYNLSESECLELIANAHNISEDSISVVINEKSNLVDSTVKKVKKAVSPVDNQIQALLAKKSKMTPEQWKKSGNADRLKTLRAKKVLNK